MKLLPTTVRMKLALTAAAGLVLMGLMTAMVLNTTVRHSRSSRALMRTMSACAASSIALRGGPPAESRVRRGAGRKAFAQAAEENLEAGAHRFPASACARPGDGTPQRLWPFARATLGTQGDDVLKLFKHGPELQQAIENAGSGDGRAALLEMRRLTGPHIRFVKTVEAEIERSDSDVARRPRGGQ